MLSRTGKRKPLETRGCHLATKLPLRKAVNRIATAALLIATLIWGGLPCPLFSAVRAKQDCCDPSGKCKRATQPVTLRQAAVTPVAASAVVADPYRPIIAFYSPMPAHRTLPPYRPPTHTILRI